jgi:hypothetical protein
MVRGCGVMKVGFNVFNFFFKKIDLNRGSCSFLIFIVL